MPYKRPVKSFKRYIPQFYSPNPSYPTSSAGSFSHNDADFFGIPLPNEKEIQTDEECEKKRGFTIPKIIKYIQKHITIEELILIGLILLILDESFDDDLLLIILIYILLF
jgi:hypothetical protein